MIDKIFGWIESIDRFFRPYRYAFDDENPEPPNRQERLEQKEKERLKKQREKEKETILKKGRKKKKDSPKHSDEKGSSREVSNDASQSHRELTDEARDEIDRNVLGVKIINVTEGRMTNENVLSRLQRSNSHNAYYYYDGQAFQIAVKFEPKSAWRYYERSNEKRKTLKPVIFPKSNKPFDRTHVIPVGYHGSENDSRLLVGFNSQINRNDLNTFEEAVRNMNETMTILWFVSIERQPDNSAKWFATVWNDEGVELKHEVFHDTDPFVWL